MEFSTEQIETIEKYAGCFLPPSDLAVILGVDPFMFKAELRNYESPARAAYLKGKTISKAQLLEQEMKLAKIGSPLGIESTKAALIQMELDE